jgi:radical SAM/Cys-rich protein
MPSLKKQNHALSSSEVQLALLNESETAGIPTFQDKLESIGLYPLRPTGIEILQVNIGKMCNQTCRHCHVDAGPDRKEIMSKDTMKQCLEAIRSSDVKTVDITGGAPEMNPHFRWFLERVSEENRSTIVRSNLTIMLANKKYHDLPAFYKTNRVNVVSSLPYYTARRTDSQRGEGVFDHSIKALKMLNAVGYGRTDSGLKLDLVYNPTGAFLPGNQAELEAEFKKRLREAHGIEFNNLFTITNLPISRFLDYLVSSGNYESYMIELANAFNPSAAMGVMCRNTISVGWDGKLYDCDFNQMLDMEIEGTFTHVSHFNSNALKRRTVRINQHCFGCTAGAGSSCGGTIT